MRLIAYTLVLAFAATQSSELVPIGAPPQQTQCPPQGCCPPQYYNCPPQYQYQRPPRQPAPQTPTPPVGSPGTPEFLPSPPQPINPPISDKLPQPTPDDKELLELMATQIGNLQSQIETLQKEVAKCKPCECEHNDAAIDAKITAAIAAIKFSQPQAINLDVITAEINKRLTHSATITLLDGTTKTQTKPLGEPLQFTQHRIGAK